jgi:hypothetical protein
MNGIKYLSIFDSPLCKKLQLKFQKKIKLIFSFLSTSDYPKLRKVDAVLDVGKYFEQFCYSKRNTLDTKYVFAII